MNLKSIINEGPTGVGNASGREGTNKKSHPFWDRTMLNKLFSKPLTLTIGGQSVSFNSINEFEFSLSGRTDVPSRKLSDLMLMSPEELKKEAKQIKVIEQQFVEVISKSLESTGGIAHYLRTIDPHVFSQDHNWRDVMISLRDKGPDYDELRRIALVKYMQYLTSRQEIIKHTYSIKKQAAKRERAKEEEMMETRLFSEPPMEAAGPAEGAMRETVILDSQVISPPPQHAQFARLPKGEAVVIKLKPKQEVDILLSKYAFKLRSDGNMFLVDQGGTAHPLQDGKNIIGRDDVCNVVVQHGLRDVSRLHLIIERLAADSLRLTDLSSHGTFLPADLLT